MSYINNDDFFKDLEEKKQIMRKKACSYKGLIPSQEFDSVFYQQYLQYATPNELANDVITKETIEKIALINTPDDVIEEIAEWYEGKYKCKEKRFKNLRHYESTLMR
jgi:predicted Rossmann-fold nucleotide-binding protein